MKSQQQLETWLLNAQEELNSMVLYPGQRQRTARIKLIATIETLKNVLQSSNKMSDIEKQRLIAGIVAQECNLTFAGTVKKRYSQSRNMVDFRRIFFLMTKENTKLTLREIGSPYRKDAVTVAYNINTAKELIETCKEFRKIYEDSKEKLDKYLK